MNALTNEEVLRGVDLGRHLSDEQLRRLAALATQTVVPAGTAIFRENQRHERLYWIIDGVVTLEMIGSHAGSKAVLTVGSGDLLAWSAFLGNQRMTTTATASTEVRLIGFDSSELHQLCEQDHEIGYRFLHSLAEAISRRLVATRIQLLDLFE